MRHGAFVMAVLLSGGSLAQAQITPAAQRVDSSRPFEIMDNSFLIEEAFNQEPGVVQNIATWTRARDGWNASVTQEWPAPGVAHQLSYTVPFASAAGAHGFGDALLNYRYQLTREGPGRAAVSPRVSLIVPTGRERSGVRDGAAGLQFNVPASKQFRNLYVHANAGWTWLPNRSRVAQVGGSGIWRFTPMFNAMLEGVVLSDRSTTLSPGFRRGWNLGEKQLVVGAAVPLTRARGTTTAAVLTYLSYELPFR